MLLEYQFETLRDDSLLWKIIANSLFHILQLLFPTIIKPFTIENWVPLHAKSLCISPSQDPFLEFWVSSIHIQVTLGLGLIYYEHLHIIHQKKIG